MNGSFDHLRTEVIRSRFNVFYLLRCLSVSVTSLAIVIAGNLSSWGEDRVKTESSRASQGSGTELSQAAAKQTKLVQAGSPSDALDEGDVEETSDQPDAQREATGGIKVPVAATPPSRLRPLPPRELAEGVLITIPADQNAEDTVIGPIDLDFVADHPELDWTVPTFAKSEPNFASKSETLLEMSREVTLRHPVWGLEFSFKPLRTIEADVPLASGNTERKLVWYLVFKLRYTGGDLLPNVTQDINGLEIPTAPKPVVFKSVRFLPRFTLSDTQSKREVDSVILSTVIPKIAARERIGKPILDTFKLSQMDIELSQGEKDKPLWGIATWVDIDPRVDFVTVQVKGLTNAYQVKVDTAGKKNYRRKTLQLHFWRPGDSLAQTEDLIRVGVPALLDTVEQEYVLRQFGLEKRLDYQWIYR